MEKAMIRIVFCTVPALIVGTIVALFDVGMGVLAFAVVLAFGVDITKARPERGEF